MLSNNIDKQQNLNLKELNLQLNLNDNQKEECKCWNKNKFSFLNNNLSTSINSINSNKSYQTNLINQTDSTNKTNQSDNLSLLKMNQLNYHRNSCEFNFKFDDSEQFYVPIEGYETLDRRTKFTVFKLRIESLSVDGLHWFVYRRFTDFQRLNDKLKLKYTNLDFLDLPSKGGLWCDIFNPLFIEKRQLSLQLYLNRLMSSKLLIKEPIVRRFLCIDDPPIASLNDYTPSIYGSESYDQLFNCNNCFVLEKKLEQMQLLIESKDTKIKELEMALESKNSN